MNNDTITAYAVVNRKTRVRYGNFTLEHAAREAANNLGLNYIVVPLTGTIPREPRTMEMWCVVDVTGHVESRRFSNREEAQESAAQWDRDCPVDAPRAVFGGTLTEVPR